ncbi:MAG: DHHA2 domain-containing protein [Candidatus Shapirobacteria bacterium]|jgi:inorganic pyrophosphatase/exopolyphosphatase
MLFVTSYSDPDLDCIACILGYTEYLAKIGIDSTGVYSGELNLEVDFVKKYTNFFPLEKHLGEFNDTDEFILVDSSDPIRIDPRIKIENIVELFDHRLTEQVTKLKNAKVHIDLVGSCSTLITEEYIKSNLVPSKNVAIYLYSAIVSNTVNFKNSVTTSRDIEIAKRLKEVAGLNDNFTKEMFLAKSNISADNLYEVLRQDFAIRPISDKMVGIAQVEMVDIGRMSTELNQVLLESLNRFYNDNKLDYIFFNGIDVIEGYNIFYTIDEASKKLFSQVLNIPELVPRHKTNSIIMRKQIFHMVEEYFKNQN